MIRHNYAWPVLSKNIIYAHHDCVAQLLTHNNVWVRALCWESMLRNEFQRNSWLTLAYPVYYDALSKDNRNTPHIVRYNLNDHVIQNYERHCRNNEPLYSAPNNWKSIIGIATPKTTRTATLLSNVLVSILLGRNCYSVCNN